MLGSARLGCARLYMSLAGLGMRFTWSELTWPWVGLAMVSLGRPWSVMSRPRSRLAGYELG